MWIAIGVLCVIVAIVLYGAQKEKDNKSTDTLEEAKHAIRTPWRLVSTHQTTCRYAK